MSINPTSPVPKYMQLRGLLLDWIEETQLAVDSPIPSERELGVRYQLSRMTVRQTIDHLVNEGRLYRVPGKGTFLARPKIEMPLRMTSFTEDMLARGFTPGSKDLARRVEPALGRIAHMLDISMGSPVHHIERLRTADGEPMAIERSNIPFSAAPDLGKHSLSDRSLYQLLEDEYGLVLDSGEQTIEAGLCDPADAELLGLPPGSAVLLLQRRGFVNGKCVELVISTYRADRYQLHSTLGPRQQG